MQDRLIVTVTVHEIDGFVRPLREADVAHERPSGELAFDVHIESIAVTLHVLHRTGADIRYNFLGGNLDLIGSRIGAVALAGHILRVSAGERKIIVGKGGARANDRDQRSGCGDNAMQKESEQGETRENEAIGRLCFPTPRPQRVVGN